MMASFRDVHDLYQAMRAISAQLEFRALPWYKRWWYWLVSL